MENDLQVGAWMARIKKTLGEFEQQLPAGLEHKLLFDQSEYTADRLATMMTNLAIGMAIVIAVLLVTLGWRAALVVASILPLASLMSITALQFLGIPIHQMSVTGLIVALGLLVDAAIVMTDEMRKNLEAGRSRLDAVKHSVDRLMVPLLASTLTTALAFTPMVLLPGPAGDFVGSIATAVIVMLGTSFALSLTIAPALAGWLLRTPAPGQKSRWWAHGLRSRPLAAAFARSLDLALRFPKLGILGAIVLPLIGFGAFPTLQAQFFPGVDRDQFYVQLKLPDGTAIDTTERVAREAGSVIRAQDGVRQVHWVIGESAPAFYYNMLANQDGRASFAEALVTTASSQTTEAILPVLQRALDKAMPQARVTVRGLVQGPPVDAPVEVRLVGTDLAVLRDLGEQIRLVMAGTSDVLQARTQMTGGAPKVKLDLDEEKVRLAGLNLASVARQLEASLEGATGGSLIEASEELPVRVRVGSANRSTLDILRATDVVGTDGPARATAGEWPGIPLMTLGTLKLEPPKHRSSGRMANASIRSRASCIAQSCPKKH